MKVACITCNKCKMVEENEEVSLANTAPMVPSMVPVVSKSFAVNQ